MKQQTNDKATKGIADLKSFSLLRSCSVAQSLFYEHII